MSLLLSDLQLREPSVVALWRMSDAAGSGSAIEWVNNQNLTRVAPASFGVPGCLSGENSTMAVSSAGGSFTVSGNNIIPFVNGRSWTIEAMTIAEPLLFAGSAVGYTVLGVANNFSLEVSNADLRLTTPVTGVATTALVAAGVLTGGPDLVQATCDGTYLRAYVNGVKVGEVLRPSSAIIQGTGQTVTVLSRPLTFSEFVPWTAIGQNIALYGAALGARRCADHFAAARQINQYRSHVSTFAPLSIPSR